MTKLVFRYLLLSSVFLIITGCKLAVMVPSGGDVTSASNTRNCPGGSLCEHNITDSTFNESFTAVAKPGYVFTKWNTGAGFLCGDSTNPTCVIESTWFSPGNAALDALFAGGMFVYAMPLFEFVGIDTDGDGQKDHVDTDDDNDGVLDVEDNCPLVGPNLDGFGCPTPLVGTPITGADIVLADSKEWAQADLFKNLSWNQINAVCPGGACGNGELNGHSMSGWTWASVDDVDALFNFYGVSPPLVGFGDVSEPNSLWAPAFFSGGWRPTLTIQTGERRLQALIRQLYPSSDDLGMTIYIVDYPFNALPGELDRVAVGGGWNRSTPGSEIGAVFYRAVN